MKQIPKTEVWNMKIRKYIALILALCLLCLSGCGKSAGGVYVQSVKTLAGYGGIAPGDRFGGIVVSENVAEIQKDSDKTVGELLVREGDDVTEGQTLFSYDTEQLQLNLDKQLLELEQLKISIDSYTEQIADLERPATEFMKAKNCSIPFRSSPCRWT